MDVTAAATLFAWVNPEVWLVTSQGAGKRGGLIATTVDQVSIVPEMPRLLVGLSRRHHTWEVVEAGGVLAVHLLGEDNIDLVWRFGLESGRDRDKFAGLQVATGTTGCPLLDGTVGWLDCRVEGSLDIGDRTLYIAEVVQGQVTHFGPPMTAGRLMELASPSQLTRLQLDRHNDGVRDAEAIRAWRRRDPK